jgi:hypothetical protein
MLLDAVLMPSRLTVTARFIYIEASTDSHLSYHIHQNDNIDVNSRFALNHHSA